MSFNVNRSLLTNLQREEDTRETAAVPYQQSLCIQQSQIDTHDTHFFLYGQVW